MPRNSAENEWFGNKAKELGFTHLKLGMSDVDLEGTWKNQVGFAQTYFNWHEGEPNNQRNGNEDCAESYIDEGFKWNDYDCAIKRKKILCTHIKGW